MRKSQIRCFNFPKTYAKGLTGSFVHFAVNLHTKGCTMLRSIICLLINLFVCAAAFCQESLQLIKQEKNVPVIETHDRAFASQLILANTHTATQLLKTPVKILSKESYYNSIGFFCKKELQLEKATKLPLKIRLGSVGYTDKMEGKGGNYLYPVKMNNQ